MSRPDRLALIERAGAGLSVRRQCALLELSRSGVYRAPSAPDAEDLALMRRIDELYLELPFYGSRRMTLALKAEGRAVNRKRVQRLMRLMGLEALVPRPGTSRPAPQHKVYPYLLRGRAITRVKQVWCADVTYIPMARGFPSARKDRGARLNGRRVAAMASDYSDLLHMAGSTPRAG